MTFTEILSAAYDELNYGASPAAGVVTRIKRFVNEGVRVLKLEPGLDRLTDSDVPYTFATVASTARYTVPDAVSVITHLSERTNDLALDVMDLGTYRRVCPDPSAITGTPSHYVPIGRVAVNAQPSNASAVFVDSSAAGDTGTAFIEGIADSTVGAITVGGRQFSGSRVMTGTTAVQLPSSIASWTEITDFYLSVAAVGHVTLCEDAEGGTELARIVPGMLRPRYYGFYLYPTPSAAVTYYVDYRRETVELVNNTDEPPLLTDAHPMLVAYAVMREAEKTQDTDKVTLMTRRYQSMLAKLKYQTAALSDDLPVAGRDRWMGRSRLGGYYPADYYIR